MTRRRRPDAHARRAKREGFPARSVYKLEEIDRRLGLLRPGQRVLDLGCAPGSWLLYVAERVGPSGRVVGVDRQSVVARCPANTVVLEADVTAPSIPRLPLDVFDVVLSDLAPHTTGDRFVDEQASLVLFRAALAIARQHLRPGGTFVGKLFHGGDYEAARNELRAFFEKVRTLRPRATRSESVEVFLAGLGRLGT